MERANPSDEFSSSMVPYVSTRNDPFDTRIPPARLVSPASPRFVLMLMIRSAFRLRRRPVVLVVDDGVTRLAGDRDLASRARSARTGSH
jgi:hypothetical protein